MKPLDQCKSSSCSGSCCHRITTSFIAVHSPTVEVNIIISQKTFIQSVQKLPIFSLFNSKIWNPPTKNPKKQKRLKGDREGRSSKMPADQEWRKKDRQSLKWEEKNKWIGYEFEKKMREKGLCLIVDREISIMLRMARWALIESWEKKKNRELLYWSRSSPLERTDADTSSLFCLCSITMKAREIN